MSAVGLLVLWPFVRSQVRRGARISKHEPRSLD